jgi:hypothetical protein
MGMVMQDDPYTYSDNMPPGTMKSVVEGMEEAFLHYEKLTVPWVLVQGAVDKLVDVRKFLYFLSPIYLTI